MKIQTKPLAMSAALATLFISSGAFAQVNQANQEPVLVTATRQVQVLKDVLADNVVISAEQIQNSGATGIVDLLQQQRGIEISRNGGVGTTASVFIRGASNPQSLVYIDGVRIGSSTTGGATWSTIPLSQIDHIEIVYGPVSSVYGADAMGGIVQIFTKRGEKKPLVHFSVGMGSERLRKVEAGVFGSFFGSSESDVQYSLNANRESNVGFSASKPGAGTYTYNLDRDGYTQKSFNGNLNWKINSDLSAGVSLLQSTLDMQFDAGAGFDDRGQTKLDTLATFVKAKLASNWNSQLQFARSDDRSLTNASYGKSSVETLQHLWTWQNDLSLGRDGLQFVAEKREEEVRASTAAIVGKRSTDSVASAYVMKQDAHLATASVRVDHSSQFGSHTTGNLAYGYRMNDVLRVNASVGTSFRAPSFNELYYPGYGVSSLKPESGKNKEIGLYFDNGETQLTSTYYHNKIEDLIVTAYPCPVEQSTHQYGCAYNVHQASLSGVTMSAASVFGAFKVHGSIDLQTAKDDTTTYRLVRRAQRHGSFGFDYRFEKATIGVESVLSGERFDDLSNKKRLGGYGLLNVVGTYRFSPECQLIARWNNILNKDYELAKNYRTAGSNFFVGMNFGFKN